MRDAMPHNPPPSTARGKRKHKARDEAHRKAAEAKWQRGYIPPLGDSRYQKRARGR